MSIGTVYCKDGKYLIHREHYARGGFKSTYRWVDDLDSATVFYALPGFHILKEVRGAEKLRVRVKELRTVILLGPDIP